MRLALISLLAAGCVSGESASHDLASRPPPPPPPPPVTALAAADGGVAAAPAKLPERAEVEMSGTIELPKGKTGETEVYVTDGPCWKKTTRALSRAGSTADRWGVEVFVPQGTSLWVCGLLAAKAGKATIHGEAGPFPGKGAGEVIFAQVPLKLKAGAPVEAPQKK